MKLSLPTIVAILSLTCGCVQFAPSRNDIIRSDVPGPAVPWTSRDVRNEPGDFRFVILSDRTGGVRPGVFESAIPKVNLLRPDFVMCVGDLITGGSEDVSLVNSQWDELDGIVRGLDAPFFYLAGNHDISNPIMAGIWHKRLGRDYYHFVYKNVLFLCLDSQDGKNATTGLSPAQVAYARDVLARNWGVRWTFVFIHQPLWRQGGGADLAGWKPVEDALKGRPCTVLAGHNHSYEYSQRDGHDSINLGTTGAGSNLGGVFYGEFDEVVSAAMTAKGPRFANLLLDGIVPKDAVTSATLAYAEGLNDKVTAKAAPLIGGATVSGLRTTPLVLKNDSDLPVSLDGEWAPNAGLTLSPPFLHVALQPGEEQVVQLGIQAGKPLPLESVAMPRIAWTQRMTPKGYGEVARRFSTSVPLDTVYPCPRAARAVKVDGDLADWPALPYQIGTRDHVTYPENWSGPEDGSFAFATAYDDQFVYVAVKTTDDLLMVDRSDVPWAQDSLAVSLDARDKQTRESVPADNRSEFKSHLLFYLSPSEKAKQIWYKQELLPAGSQAVCVAAGQGMILEIAIPAAYLNDLQGGHWTTFQMNVLFNDVDAHGKSPIRWRPDWNGQTYPGSGTFRRE